MKDKTLPAAYNIEDNKFCVRIGFYWPVVFYVSDREGTRKTPRNLAVSLQTNHMVYDRVMTNSLTVERAIFYLCKLDIDPNECGFVDLLIKKGWRSELPSQYSGVNQGGLYNE